MEPVNLINKINKKENININRNSRNNYYYLKYEEHLSSYISNNINLYIKDKKNIKIFPLLINKKIINYYLKKNENFNISFSFINIFIH